MIDKSVCASCSSRCCACITFNPYRAYIRLLPVLPKLRLRFIGPFSNRRNPQTEGTSACSMRQLKKPREGRELKLQAPPINDSVLPSWKLRTSFGEGQVGFTPHGIPSVEWNSQHPMLNSRLQPCTTCTLVTSVFMLAPSFLYCPYTVEYQQNKKERERQKKKHTSARGSVRTRTYGWRKQRGLCSQRSGAVGLIQT